jgi:fido (protein-threonine AMPylation protein)
MSDQQPAGTYARKVLEQLLIDLSWSSSRLEGNRRTLLETEELFTRGTEDGDLDSVMLLNHKRAIEFLVDAVPEYGLTDPLIRNLHSLLMQDLLSDPRGLGEIRSKIVNIRDTVYVPSQVPKLLESTLNEIIGRSKLIKNPVEAAFFLWVNIAYLQPFEDGNKRTSRLAANIPLMIYNCAPLSFLDVNLGDYALAMMGVYEQIDTALAADLFAWTYRRSIRKYAVVLDSVGAPDPFRLKHRERLSNAVQLVVRDGRSTKDAIKSLDVLENDVADFTAMLKAELASLTVRNCARHRLTMKVVEEWIKNRRRT